jgi:pimeloyl-ACP methyl ester carboxylesterase
MKTLLKVLIGLVILIVVAGGVGIILTWAPDRSTEELKARWAQPPSKFLDLQGLNVHYREVGPADDLIPIVLIHGLSSSLHTWEGWVETLKIEHRVISVDLPGSGLTGPAPKNEYSIEADTQFIIRFLNAIGVHLCILAGNSRGGEIAWHVAVTEPLLVNKLILVDAGGYPLTPKEMPQAFRVASKRSLHWVAEHLLSRRVVEASVRTVFGDPARVTPALVDRYFELSLHAGNRPALAQRIAQMKPGADIARLNEIGVPTLILWGAKDKLLVPENAEQFHQAIADSQLVVYDDLGHVPQEEDPVRTVADVRKFLAQKPAEPTPESAPEPTP